MTHVQRRMQTTCGKGLRPVDRYMMYTDIDFKYHSQLSTAFNLTVNYKPIILTHARRRDWYCRAYPFILQVTVKISRDSSTRVHHLVMALSRDWPGII